MLRKLIYWPETIPETISRVDCVAEALCGIRDFERTRPFADSLLNQLRAVRLTDDTPPKEREQLEALESRIIGCGLAEENFPAETSSGDEVVRAKPSAFDLRVADDLIRAFEALDGWGAGQRLNDSQTEALEDVCAIRHWFKGLQWEKGRNTWLRRMYDDLDPVFDRHVDIFLQYRKQAVPSPADYSSIEGSAKLISKRLAFEHHVIDLLNMSYHISRQDLVLLESVRVVLRAFYKPSRIPGPLAIDYYTVRKRLDVIEAYLAKQPLNV